MRQPFNWIAQTHSIRPHVKLFVNDHLSPPMNNLAYNCRMLRKNKLIADTWSLNGTLKMRLLNNEIIIVQHEIDIFNLFPNFEEFTFDMKFYMHAHNSLSYKSMVNDSTAPKSR